MVGVFVVRKTYAGLTGHSIPDPAGLRLGWPAVADVNPVLRKTAAPGPRQQKDSPGPPNAVSLWRYFVTCRMICMNVQIASTLEQNPFLLGAGMAEFLHVPNTFRNLSADLARCTLF